MSASEKIWKLPNPCGTADAGLADADADTDEAAEAMREAAPMLMEVDEERRELLDMLL